MVFFFSRTTELFLSRRYFSLRTVYTYSVNLAVLDSNDESPVFLNEPRPFLTTVRSNTPPGTILYKLNASDPDTGSSLRFYINGMEKIHQRSKIGSKCMRFINNNHHEMESFHIVHTYSNVQYMYIDSYLTKVLQT
jgi:hypothetical protein